jgi:undecaprenyl-diphosphatase
MKALKINLCGIFAVSLIGIISFIYDEPIAIFFKGLDNKFLTNLSIIFDSIWVMIAIYLGLMIVIARKKDLKSVRPMSLALISTLVISSVIKLLIMRERPFGITEVIPFINLIDYSFPSNHAAVVFAAVPFINKELKKYKYFWIVFAVLIALSRVYLNLHYLSDVIFGGLLGYLVGIIAMKIFERKNKYIM